jgi:lipopolysaccharide export system protein LptA
MSMEKYYNTEIIRPALLLVALIIAGDLEALTSDKDQPIEIEADNAELDDKKGVTIYRGNVVVTQGSIHMTGDTMTVYYTESNDLDTVIMEGQPATYRQLPDDSEVYDEAEALRMEYHELKNLIVLIDNAVVKQEGLRFSGNRIEYDTERSQIKARGRTATEISDDAGGQETEKGDRVRITIKPKKKD